MFMHITKAYTMGAVIIYPSEVTFALSLASVFWFQGDGIGGGCGVSRRLNAILVNISDGPLRRRLWKLFTREAGQLLSQVVPFSETSHQSESQVHRQAEEHQEAEDEGGSAQRLRGVSMQHPLREISCRRWDHQLTQETGQVEFATERVVHIKTGASRDPQPQTNPEAAHPGGAIFEDVHGVHEIATGVRIDETRFGEVLQHAGGNEADDGTGGADEQGGDIENAIASTPAWKKGGRIQNKRLSLFHW